LGQSQSAGRKRARREEKARQLAESAMEAGISVMELVRRRVAEMDDIRIHSAIFPRTRQQWISASASPPKRSVLDGFRDDDRRWKW